MAMDQQGGAYPVRLDIDYPEEGLDRLSTALRIIFILPILLVIVVIAGGYLSDNDSITGIAASGGIVFFPTVLMLVFRQKYPRWWFTWNVELSRFSTRVSAYFLLMRDEYPSTDEEQAIHLEIDYPDAERDLNRWLPLVKWLLAIPHYIVLAILVVVGIPLMIIAWFAILITGRYPRPIFNYVLGVARWQLRVEGYVWLLVTDRYPPFSFNELT